MLFCKYITLYITNNFLINFDHSMDNIEQGRAREDGNDNDKPPNN